MRMVTRNVNANGSGSEMGEIDEMNEWECDCRRTVGSLFRDRMWLYNHSTMDLVGPIHSCLPRLSVRWRQQAPVVLPFSLGSCDLVLGENLGMRRIGDID